MSILNLPIRTDMEARQTANLVKVFRERLRFLDLERTSLQTVVDEYEQALMNYHRRIRHLLTREAAEAERVAEEQEEMNTNG